MYALQLFLFFFYFKERLLIFAAYIPFFFSRSLPLPLLLLLIKQILVFALFLSLYFSCGQDSMHTPVSGGATGTKYCQRSRHGRRPPKKMHKRAANARTNTWKTDCGESQSGCSFIGPRQNLQGLLFFIGTTLMLEPCSRNGPCLNAPVYLCCRNALLH